MAYRGRVLLELQTVFGERPIKLVDDILHDDVLRVQVTDLSLSLSLQVHILCIALIPCYARQRSRLIV